MTTTVGTTPERTDATTAVELNIGGMSCAACAGRIEKRLNRIDGVRATVNYATERAIVQGLPAEGGVEAAIAAVEKSGYTAAPRSDADDEWSRRSTADRITSLRRRLIVAALLTVPLCDITIILALVPEMRFPGWELVCVLLALPIVTWAAWPFHRATWRNLRHGTLSMDTLVSLGIAASYGWAVVTLLTGASTEPGYWLGFGMTPEGADSIYLDVAAGMTTFQLAGRYFETRSRRRAGDVLDALNGLAATHVRRRTDEGTEELCPVGELRRDDVFIVLPGETIAADGEILEGAAAVDASMMTGEPVPAELGVGDGVIGGTVSTNGRLVVRAGSVGAHTQLAQMAAVAERAQERKARVQTLVDRVVSVFVPAVIVLSVVVMIGWMIGGADARTAFGTAIAVLIIACPCALGLATPTALMVGVGRGAQLGILIKSQDALEASGTIDTVVLDKTGTITTGEMSVVGFESFGARPRPETVRLLASLEAGSEHPIARAIVEEALRTITDLDAVTEVETIPGRGARGIVSGRAVLAGSPRLLAEERIALSPAAADALAREEAEGRTVILCAIDGELSALVALADTVKPSAADAVARLKALGLNTIMVTGDHAAAAESIGAAIGVDRVLAGVLPTEKAEMVAALQREGRRVAMVGDGINDAAALATANLGLAVVSGTDIAMRSADIILVRDDLSVIPDAVLLARKTLRTIRGNLFWAFGYNVAAIPLAAAGLLNPLIAAAAMSLSSVLVVSNSLRLRNFRPGQRR